MAALAAARRQLWIAQARLPYKDKALLLDAPVTPGTPKSRFRLLQPLLELMHRTVFTVRNTEAAHKQQPQAVGESLLYMLECSLGPGYSTELREAWVTLYAIVVETMSSGWTENGENKSD
ncbi:UNVERIFIED_CONTAM: hypothetical protein FKN15_002009 [Acipenser sinensis]